MVKKSNVNTRKDASFAEKLTGVDGALVVLENKV